MAADAVAAVRNGDLKIIPEHHTKTWYYWMEGIRDWCVSRQLWWGHRIPAYFVSFNDTTYSASNSSDDEDYWIVARTEQEAIEKACKKFNVDSSAIVLKQDEDVLDTWFSSGLFPFSVFGWPENTDDIQAFYPTTLLETGHDIIFFWVARMVFFGQKLLGKLPFKEIYLHQMVRDAHGRKMSKSLGNVIDPIDVITGISLENLQAQLMNSNLDPREIEKAKAGQTQDFPNGIPECGTDALRFALCAYITQSRDINLDINRVQGYRFFCNKLWNATKFALMYFVGEIRYSSTININGDENNMDIWILSRLSTVVDACNRGFDSYDFAAATTASYSFWLYDLCDVYLECLKPIFQSGSESQKISARQTLFTCLDIGLRILSPFMPFITEELYQRLPHANQATSICVAAYPENTSWINKKVEKEVDFIQKVARVIRSARSDYNLPNKTKTEAYIASSDPEENRIIRKYCQELATLSYCSKVCFENIPANGCAILTITGQCELHLLLKGLIEAEKEIIKLEKKKDQLESTISKIKEAMSFVDYENKVPTDVQAMNVEKIHQSTSEIERIINAIESLKLM